MEHHQLFFSRWLIIDMGKKSWLDIQDVYIFLWETMNFIAQLKSGVGFLALPSRGLETPVDPVCRKCVQFRLVHWIGLREHLQENFIFNGKIYGLL